MSRSRRSHRSHEDKVIIEAWKKAIKAAGDEYQSLLESAGLDETRWTGANGYAKGNAELAEELLELHAPLPESFLKEAQDRARSGWEVRPAPDADPENGGEEDDDDDDDDDSADAYEPEEDADDKKVFTFNI